MGNHSDALPSAGKLQTDGWARLASKLPHIVTAVISVAGSLGIASYLHLGGVGPAGPAGKSANTQSYGVCAYFGPDGHGKSRFQLSSPVNGECAKGVFVSVK